MRISWDVVDVQIKVVWRLAGMGRELRSPSFFSFSALFEGGLWARWMLGGLGSELEVGFTF